MFLFSSSCFQQYFYSGALAYSTTLCPALLSRNTTDISATQDQSSWLCKEHFVYTSLISNIECIIHINPLIVRYCTFHIFVFLAIRAGWVPHTHPYFLARAMRKCIFPRKKGGALVELLTTSKGTTRLSMSVILKYIKEFIKYQQNNYSLFSAASLGFFGVIEYLILSCIMEAYGLKTVHLIFNIIQLVGWIVFYFTITITISVTALFIGRFFQGIGVAVLYINGV